MPADTRSSRKVKRDDTGRSKERLSSDNGSQDVGSKKSTSSTKHDNSSPSSTRKSERLRTPTPSPLRRSERTRTTPNSGKLDKSSSLAHITHKIGTRKRGIDDLVMQANQVAQRGKKVSNANSQIKKRLTSRRYKSLFKPSEKKVKPSDAAKESRPGDNSPCSSSNSGSYCTKTIPVAEEEEEDSVNEKEGKCKEDNTKRASKADQGGLNSDLKEVASETSKPESIVEPHSGQKHVCAAEPCKSDGVYCSQISEKGELPLNPPVGVSATCSKRQRIDGLSKDICSNNATLSQDAFQKRSPEDCGRSDTSADMDICGNAVPNIQEKDLTLDAQMDSEENKCIICKSAGKLVYCGGKGCRSSCHPACLNSHWKDVYPGIWHCPWCTKKKIDAGVHSISEGIESIWDMRMEDDQNREGVKRQKEYFVKYKGLAHVHNCWLPEKQLLQEAPQLVAEFVRRESAIKWMPDWTIPHRLLQKRSLVLPKSDGSVGQEAGSTLNCQHEWLVKWCSLDYSKITWELEDAGFLQTPKAHYLMNEYERRCEKARRAPLSHEVDGIQEKKNGPPIELSTFSSGCDTSYLNFIKDLRDYWSRGQNAIIIGGQEQVAQAIYFISSLESNVSRPFFIIAPPSSISKWEAEFSCLAPSINTVVYDGNRDAREMIRTLEFYEDGPRVMFEVLLSTSGTIKEDLKFMKCIKWEAVIIDECHKSQTLPESIFVKELASGSMLILLMEQINDDAIDYCNILSLLKCNDDSCAVDSSIVGSSSSVTGLKERLSPFIVNGCKSLPSRLIEYWVPVEMSNMQLEEYCFCLLSNLVVLCSKNDPVGALRDILTFTRKCCDHPYIVDSTLQGQLLKRGTPVEMLLDFGVKASGKLYLLDAVLTEMKDQGKKVVILFKSFGRDLLGDILDDFVRQRFGTDSYERIDSGRVPSKKQASVTKFNNERRIFIFLLETRACSPTIKLQSVDAVIIFGSDWNPLNDLRALQKIKIDSKVEQINVFRLYTLCTIEEKALFLSKRSSIFLESTLQGINYSTSHMLLTWGASYLFRKLEEFHKCDGSTEIMPGNSILKDVAEEFKSLLQKHGSCTRSKFISRAWKNGGCYSKDISLLGEQYVHLEGEDQPHFFWAKILKGKQPKWRYLSSPSQRNRKRVPYCDGTSETNFRTDEGTKRQKKRANTNGQPCSSPSSKDAGKEPVSGLLGDSTIGGPELYPNSADGASAAGKFQAATSTDKLHDEQKKLHQILKPDMAELFQILGLQEDVQKMAERFLEYVINNHHVIREPETVLQAFKISVCWISASLLRKKLDHVESLALAREHLKFHCSDDEAEYVFSKMRSLRKMFLHRSENISLQASLKGVVPGAEDTSRETINGNLQESTVSTQQKVEVEEELLVEDISKDIKKIKKCCRKRLDRLMQKHWNEVEELNKLWREKKDRLEKDYRLESAIIRSINTTFRSDKLKTLEHDHKQKLDQLDSEMAAVLKDTKARHQAEIDEEEGKSIRLLEDFNSRARDEVLLDDTQSKDAVEECREEEVLIHSSSSGNNLEEENANRIVDSSANVQVEPSGIPESHKITENTGSVEVAVVPVDNDKFISDNDFTPAASQANDEATSENVVERAVANRLDVQSSHVAPAIAANEVARVATSGCDQSSLRNPTIQADINAEVETAASPIYTVPGIEQHDEDSRSIHVESTYPPSTINESIVQPVVNLHQADSMPVSQELGSSSGRLDVSNGQHVCAETTGIQNTMIQDEVPSSNHSDTMPCNASNDAVPQLAASLATAVSPVDSTQPCLPSRGVPVNQLSESSVQEDQRPPNLSVEAYAHPPLGTSFPPHNPSQVENHLPARSLLAATPTWVLPQDFGKGFDPLQREYERICGESNQAHKNYEETVSCLKLECDKEVEELIAQIRKKYDTKLLEAEASFLQKKNELDHNQRKVLKSMALAEAFRSKCIDHRAAQGAQQAAPSNLTQQLLESQHPTRRSLVPAAIVPQAATIPLIQNDNCPPVYSSMPSTLPQRSNILSCSSGHRLVGREVRLPAPCPESFRTPSTSTMSPFVQTAAMMCQLLNGINPRPSQPPRLQAPVYTAASYGELHLPETFVRPTPMLQNDDSATELLINADQTVATSASLSSLPEVARNFESLNLSEFGTSLDVQQPDPCQIGTVANDVVCLSDDE